jgi:hypothetical protein
MKLFKSNQQRSGFGNPGAFTLVEVMLTVGIFLFIFVGAMVAVQIFGLRVYTLAATKLVATTSGRETLNQIRDQVRSSKLVYVGTCSSPGYSSFSLLAGATNAVQRGNALIIYPTTNGASGSIYYLETNCLGTIATNSANWLVQFNFTNTSWASGSTNWTVTYTNILAQYITNTFVFDMEDWQGTICTNSQALDNRLLIGVTLQFSQWEYPIAVVGGSGFNAYDYYQLRTRVFRRAWN